jgi:heme-degrading monooxygenase HmoA
VSVNEISRLTVNRGQQASFVEEAHTFANILDGDDGCRHVDMFQGVEDPDSFVFVITWASQEAHKAFQRSDRGKQALSAIRRYLDEPPATSHYEALELP